MLSFRGARVNVTQLRHFVQAPHGRRDQRRRPVLLAVESILRRLREGLRRGGRRRGGHGGDTRLGRVHPLATVRHAHGVFQGHGRVLSVSSLPGRGLAIRGASPRLVRGQIREASLPEKIGHGALHDRFPPGGSHDSVSAMARRRRWWWIVNTLSHRPTTFGDSY